MNNNMPGIAPIPTNINDSMNQPVQSFVQPQVNTTVSADINNQVSQPFDIFAQSVPQMPQVPVQPVVEPTPQAMPQMGGFQFDMPTMNPVETPVVEPTPQAMPQMGGFQFDMPTMNPVETPVVEPTPQAMPEMGGFQFDENGMVTSAPQAVQEPSIETVPQTAPIVETPIEPQIIPTMPEITEQSVEPVMPEIQPTTINQEIPASPQPIIITDYSKQYDPVMPQQEMELPPKVDFREVINAIRECSNKIEQYGFKIDVEEYDLANLYQVVFKVEK